MLFSELYSVYYNTVAKLLNAALSSSATEKELKEIVARHAFSESCTVILPSIKSEKWQLMDEDLFPIVEHTPTMPLTLLQKRWLKAILSDRRMRLFGVSLDGLEDIEPLFTEDDFRVYDQYTDGDPYEDGEYIRTFRILLSAIKTKSPVKIRMVTGKGKEISLIALPTGLEYSLKDDKFRLRTDKTRFGYINLARIIACTPASPLELRDFIPQQNSVKELTLRITDERGALERAMLHFAHFEKSAERIDGMHYLLRLKYHGDDETELVIRILSFGPCIEAMEPQGFVDLIRERLATQKKIGIF